MLTKQKPDLPSSGPMRQTPEGGEGEGSFEKIPRDNMEGISALMPANFRSCPHDFNPGRNQMRIVLQWHLIPDC